MREAPAIETRDLVKRFGRGDSPVLDHVDMRVAAGEMVALTGPSGGGKSTLVHLLAALDRPTSGHVVVDGVDLAVRSRHAAFRRTSVGVVFQLHNLLPRLTAVENVEVAMLGTGRARADRRHRALDLLAELDMEHLGHRRPTHLSGGERQRIAIARALANEPRVILADEPTGHLDPLALQIAMRVFERLRCERGVTILIVTHDETVASAADRRMELVDGHLQDCTTAAAAPIARGVS